MDTIEYSNILYDMINQNIGAETFALDMYKAMDKDTFISIAEYICRCYDLPYGKDNKREILQLI